MSQRAPEVEEWDGEDIPRRLRDPGNPYALLAAQSDQLAQRIAANMRRQDVAAEWIERVLLDAGYDARVARFHARPLGAVARVLEAVRRFVRGVRRGAA